MIKIAKVKNRVNQDVAEVNKVQRQIKKDVTKVTKEKIAGCFDTISWLTIRRFHFISR